MLLSIQNKDVSLIAQCLVVGAKSLDEAIKAGEEVAKTNITVEGQQTLNTLISMRNRLTVYMTKFKGKIPQDASTVQKPN